MALSTDFKDDILNESVNTKRKYNVIHNDDGTESYEDVTSYSQTGSQYGAKEVIAEREAINQLQNDVDALNSALSGKLYTDSEGWIQGGIVTVNNPDVALRIFKFGRLALLSGEITASREINPTEHILRIPGELGSAYPITTNIPDSAGEVVVVSLWGEYMYSDSGIEAGRTIKINIVYALSR